MTNSAPREEDQQETRRLSELVKAIRQQVGRIKPLPDSGKLSWQVQELELVLDLLCEVETGGKDQEE